jgi:hypothetical protein
VSDGRYVIIKLANRGIAKQQVVKYCIRNDLFQLHSNCKVIIFASKGLENVPLILLKILRIKGFNMEEKFQHYFQQNHYKFNCNNI